MRMVRDFSAVGEVVGVLLATAGRARHHGVRPEMVREIVVNRPAGAIHSGDALAVEIDIFLIDRASEIAFGQGARWARPVHGP